jgi:hypothetical protein
MHRFYDRSVSAPFVPDDFVPPDGLVAEAFVLEPLGPEHNERDHAAWMSSIAFIHTLPGFDDPGVDDPWPVPMSLEENLEDLRMHARDFAERTGFTYTVLDPGDRDVIGCLYIYPSLDADHDARLRSWVRASHAHLDAGLRREVAAWLDRAWPFATPAYAAGS